MEPLTTPALGAMLTSLYPHEHGATRNGMRLRPGWRRWRGLSASAATNRRLRGELDAQGPSLGVRRALRALRGGVHPQALARPVQGRGDGRGPHRRGARLARAGSGSSAARSCSGCTTSIRTPPTGCTRRWPGRSASISEEGAPASPSADRYDSEIAFADRHLGRLLAAFDADPELRANTLFVFAGDHGESLGEHGDWGHGRNLYEPALHIPLGIAWAGRGPRRRHDRRAGDEPRRPPTVLGLLGLRDPPAAAGFRGVDWTAVLRRGGAEPGDAGADHRLRGATGAPCCRPARRERRAATGCWRWG